MNEVDRGHHESSVSTKKLAAILRNPSLKITEFRILAHLLGYLEGDSYRPVSITELAHSIGQDRPRVSTAMATLAEQKIITRGPKIGRSYTYRINL